jgi:hypothetical protein
MACLVPKPSPSLPFFSQYCPYHGVDGRTLGFIQAFNPRFKPRFLDDDSRSSASPHRRIAAVTGNCLERRRRDDMSSISWRPAVHHQLRGPSRSARGSPLFDLAPELQLPSFRGPHSNKITICHTKEQPSTRPRGVEASMWALPLHRLTTYSSLATSRRQPVISSRVPNPDRGLPTGRGIPFRLRYPPNPANPSFEKRRRDKSRSDQQEPKVGACLVTPTPFPTPQAPTGIPSSAYLIAPHHTSSPSLAGQ